MEAADRSEASRNHPKRFFFFFFCGNRCLPTAARPGEEAGVVNAALELSEMDGAAFVAMVESSSVVYGPTLLADAAVVTAGIPALRCELVCCEDGCSCGGVKTENCALFSSSVAPSSEGISSNASSGRRCNPNFFLRPFFQRLNFRTPFLMRDDLQFARSCCSKK